MALPRIYIESDTIPKGDRMLLTDPEFQIVVRSSELAEKIVKELDEPIFYEQVVYEEARSVFDVPEAKVTRHVIIEPEDRRSLIFLKPGDRVYQIPVEGYVVTPIADVGDRLRKGDPLAAVTTRSGNVRYVEAPQDCMVVYVCEQPTIRSQKRPNYEYYIAPIK